VLMARDRPTPVLVLEQVLVRHPEQVL